MAKISLKERRLLNRVRKLESRIGILTELCELRAAHEDAKAAEKFAPRETALRRELADKEFACLPREELERVIIEHRQQAERQKAQKLQYDALVAGMALNQEQQELLTSGLQRRLERIEAEVRRELDALPAPSAESGAQAAERADTDKRIEELRAASQAEAEAKKAALRQSYAQKLEKLNAKKSAAEEKLRGIAANEMDAELEEGVALDVDGLKMHFGGVKAVDGLSFKVHEGEIFGLIGPNGAGKTTVFNCITQFYKPTAGKLLFRGRGGKVIDLTREHVHDVILHGIVRTFQNVEVVREMSVLENLLVAGHRQFSSGLFSSALHLPKLAAEEEVVMARAMKVLEFMGLTAYGDHLAFGLPYGVLKKIEIARTLMCSPRLIILDEPAAGLNDTETAELAGIIRRIRDEYNCTILLVEHDMGLVMDVCDNICAIAFGKLLAYGTPAEIQKDEGVQQAYLGADDEEAE